MTRDQLVAQVQALMGFRTDQGTTIAAQIAIQQSALELEEQWIIRPWFLQVTRTTGLLTIGDEEFARPEGFIAEIEEDGLWLTNSEGDEILLEKADEDDLRLLYGNEDNTQPSYYASAGLTYRVFPKADDTYTIKQRYYKQDETLADGSDTNLWLTHAPNCIIGRVGLFLTGAAAAKQRDMFSGIYLSAKAGLERRSMDLLTDNRRYAMGETA